MDKLKYIKLKQEDGSYSNAIPLSVDGNYIDINGNSLTVELSNKAELSNLNTLTTRVDNLSHLSEGSTTGDAELIDIRTGYDGKNYNNAGDAVREQFNGVVNGYKKLGIYFSNHFFWTGGSTEIWRRSTYPISFEADKEYLIQVEKLSDNEIIDYNIYLMENTTMDTSAGVKRLINNSTFTLTAQEASRAKYIQIRSTGPTTLRGSFNLTIYSDIFVKKEEIIELQKDIEIIGNTNVGKNLEIIDTYENAISNVWNVSNGKLIIGSSLNYYKLTYLDVNSEENYIISSYYGGNQKISYIFATDDEMNIVAQYNSNAEGLWGKFTSSNITIPRNATKLYIGQYGTDFLIKVYKNDICPYAESIINNSIDLLDLDFVKKVESMELQPIQNAKVNWAEKDTASWHVIYIDINWDITKDSYIYFTDIPNEAINMNVVYGLEKNFNTANIKYRIVNGNSITENYLKIPGWTYTGEGTISYLIIYANTNLAWESGINIFQNGFFYHMGEVEEDIKSIEEEIGTLESDPEMLLPQYYFTDNYLYNKIDAVKENILNSENAISFTFATDLHFPSNTKNSKYMLKAILDKTLVPFALFGGDYPGAYGTKSNVDMAANEWLKYINYLGKDRCFSVQGNHDWTINHNNVEGETGFTGQDSYIYNYFGRSMEAYVGGLEYPNLYYYIDIPAQRTRIFMLNSCDSHSTIETQDWGVSYSFGKNQLKWLIEKINEVQNYNFIAIAHIPGDSAFSHGYSPSQLPLQNLLIALKNKTSYSETLDGETVTADFSTTTNEIACLITGHAHYDQDHVNNNLLNIGVTCDAAYNDDQWAPATRGTIKENAFDVFTIDFTNKTIKTVRFGRGENRNWTFI